MVLVSQFESNICEAIILLLKIIHPLPLSYHKYPDTLHMLIHYCITIHDNNKFYRPVYHHPNVAAYDPEASIYVFWLADASQERHTHTHIISALLIIALMRLRKLCAMFGGKSHYPPPTKRLHQKLLAIMSHLISMLMCSVNELYTYVQHKMCIWLKASYNNACGSCAKMAKWNWIWQSERYLYMCEELDG